MLDIAFWVLFIITPLAALKLLKISGERVNEVGVISVTTVALYAFSVIGTLPIFYEWDVYRLAIGVNDRQIIFQVLLYSCINVICFLLGVIFFKRIMKIKRFVFLSSDIEKSSQAENIALLLVLIFSLSIFYVYLKNLDRVALFVALEDGGKEAGLVRSEMGNDFQGSYHWYRLGIYGLSQMLTYTFFAAWLREGKRWYFLLFILSLCYAVLVSILATEKAPLVWLLVGLYMTSAVVKRNGKMKFGKTLFLSFAIVSLLVIMYQYFMDAGTVLIALTSVFSRAFSGSITPAYFYLEYFPYHRDYMMGASFPNPGGIFPYTPVRYTVEVMNWVFPSLRATGVIGTMPTVFWGESYANFGPIGVPVIAILMGSLVAAINYLVLKIELKPITIGFYIWLILELKNLAETGFSSYIYNISVLAMFAVIIFVLAAKGNVKFRGSKTKIEVSTHE